MGKEVEERLVVEKIRFMTCRKKLQSLAAEQVSTKERIWRAEMREH